MTQAANNRAAMPTVAALVDELRAKGLEPRVIYASENGKTLGAKPQYREVFDIPQDYRKPVGGWKA
jgi:hypothetical protein